MNTKLIYWPKGGSVEEVANKLTAKLTKHQTSVCCVEDLDYTTIDSVELLIVGGSTVGADHWENSAYKDAWTGFFKTLAQDNISLKGKKVALFGLGNQVLYPEHFVDSMKEIADLVTASGATLVGATENKGYDFVSSEALVDGKFIGLALDEDTQAAKTDARLEAWVSQLGL